MENVELKIGTLVEYRPAGYIGIVVTVSARLVQIMWLNHHVFSLNEIREFTVKEVLQKHNGWGILT